MKKVLEIDEDIAKILHGLCDIALKNRELGGIHLVASINHLYQKMKTIEEEIKE